MMPSGAHRAPRGGAMRAATAARIGGLAVMAVACASSASATVESTATGTWQCRVVNDAGRGDAFTAEVTVRPAHSFAIAIHGPGQAPAIRLGGTWSLSGTTLHVTLRAAGQVGRLTYTGV